MSIEICKKILNRQFTERVGRTEYCDHPRLIEHIAGIYQKAHPDDTRNPYKKFLDWVPYDLIWNANDGPVGWSELGRTTDMGHAVYAEGG
ncbi:MAG TPA: hypothetical protein PLW07_00470, partial [bacterium]|nr:hypothetical protein [bacterium]